MTLPVRMEKKLNFKFKRKRTIVFLLLLSVLISILSVAVFASERDYSRPGTTGLTTLDSAEILNRALGLTLSPEEERYLDLYAEETVSYGSNIPTSTVNTSYDKETKTLTVKASVYSYTANNGVKMSWIPESAEFDGEKIPFSLESGEYTAHFPSVLEEDGATVAVLYKTSVLISEGVLNSLQNKAYSEALSWKKYKTYLFALDEYEREKELYRNYLVSKSIYDERLAAYKVYLGELEEYNAANSVYENYLAALDAYNTEYEAYQKYLEEKKTYDSKMALYNKYVENMIKVEHQIGIIDGSMTPKTTMYRSIYHAIMGDLVKTVVENKDLIANEFVGASGNAVDLAGESAVALKEMYTLYATYKTNIEKYTYYTVNYEKFRDNINNLFRALDKLYENAKVRIAIEEKGIKEKFEILLAQLYYVSAALSDTPVENFDKTGYFDTSYRINRKTPLEIHENQPYVVDKNMAAPIKGGYPSKVEMPTITEASEPVKPETVQKPIAPVPLENPGAEPTRVEKPIPPSYVAPVWQLDEPSVLPEGVEEIISALDSSLIVEREPITVPSAIPLEIAVTKTVFGAREINVTFCDSDGNVLCVTTVEYGTYAEFSGKVPTKKSDAAADYVLAGWQNEDGESVDITALKYDTDVRLYPLFEAKPKYYQVVWELDGENLYTIVRYGEIPVPPVVPTRESSAIYKYVFSGWNKELSPVVGNSALDRYAARFERKYILPVTDDAFGSEIGGGSVSIDTDTVVADCTIEKLGTSCVSFSAGIEDLLEYARELNGKILLKTDYFNISIGFAEIAAMADAGASRLAMLPIQSQNEFYFTPVIKDKDGKEIPNILLKIEFFTFRTDDAENSRIYYSSGEERVYVTGEVSEDSLAVSALSSRTYHVSAQYSLNLLPTGPVTVTVDKLVGASGETVKFTASAPPGVKIRKIFLLDAEGMRTDIEGQSFVMQRGGLSLGVEYEYIEYTVSFISSGRIVGTRTYRYGDIPEIPPDPIRSSDGVYSYEFIAWSAPVVAVEKSVNYEALYRKIPLPPKEEPDGLIISDSMLSLIVKAGTLFLFVTVVFIPCTVIFTVKLVIRIRRKVPSRAKKQK